MCQVMGRLDHVSRHGVIIDHRYTVPMSLRLLYCGLSVGPPSYMWREY